MAEERKVAKFTYLDPRYHVAIEILGSIGAKFMAFLKVIFQAKNGRGESLCIHPSVFLHGHPDKEHNCCSWVSGGRF